MTQAALAEHLEVSESTIKRDRNSAAMRFILSKRAETDAAIREGLMAKLLKIINSANLDPLKQANLILRLLGTLTPSTILVSGELGTRMEVSVDELAKEWIEKFSEVSDLAILTGFMEDEAKRLRSDGTPPP